MEYIFGIEGKWVDAKKQHCKRCALNEFCDKIIGTEVEVPYICADSNPFSHRYFLSLQSFMDSIREQVREYVNKYNLRKGQAIFNAIDIIYPRLGAFVKDSMDIDCFYKDENIVDFLNACYAKVDSPEYMEFANKK